MRTKPKLLKALIIFCCIGYACLSGFLIYQASLNGTESSEQSGAVGDELSGIVNESKGDQTILIDPTGLEIENIITSGKVGKSHQLKCKTLPKNASYKSLKYETSNKKIASVSSSGLIKFLDQGEVEIKVYNKDFPKISKTFAIEIEKINLESFSSILLDGKEEVEKESDVYLLKQYESYTIKNTFTPKDASIQKVTYTYNKEYLTISNNKLSAKKPVDELTITMKCDGLENSFKISIEEVIIPYVDLIDYSLSKTKINMNVKESIKLSSNPFGASFNPADATDKNLSYTSKNTDVVAIENNSLVAKDVGVATIEIVSQDKEIKKEVEIEVKNIIALKEEAFDIEQEYFEYNDKDNTYHIRNGLGGDINCNFTDNSTYKTATYSSSNEKVLLIGDDGSLTPIKIGKATITVTIDDGYSTPLVYELDFVVEGKPFIENLSGFYYIVRKSIGHFGAFFVLGGLGAFAFLLTFDRKRWLFSAPLTIGLGFGMAALTEYIQTFVPGRYGCWDDVWLDFSGYISSTILVFIFLAIVYTIIRFKNKKTAN